MKKIINKMPADWQEALASAGYRLSEPRRQVVHLLQGAEVPLTPLEIHHQLSAAGCRLGQASVYRTLDLLTTLGIVTVVYRPDASAGYMLAARGHHHHIICQVCQRAVVFEGSEDLRELILLVEKQTRFKVSDHLLQLYGLCPSCQPGEG